MSQFEDAINEGRFLILENIATEIRELLYSQKLYVRMNWHKKRKVLKFSG
jgi:hypothetical protein